MANSPYTDRTNQNALLSSQQPIVLARLPRIGAEQSVLVSPAPAQTTPPPPTPEAVPYIELRDQIEQRTELHIANTPNDEASTSHFVDREHRGREPSVSPQAIEPSPTLNMPAVQIAKRQAALRQRTPPSTQPRPQTLRTQATQAKPATANEDTVNENTFSGKMFQWHSRLAPHAGLIVALALIASAGLLYWMIVGPAQTPSSHFNRTGELHEGGFDATSHTMPEDYQPEFIAVLPTASEPAGPHKKWVEVPLSVTQESETLPIGHSIPMVLPQVQPVTTQDLPSNESLQFPTTHHPGKLDFSKAGITTSYQPSLDASQVRPELVRRPTSSSPR